MHCIVIEIIPGWYINTSIVIVLHGMCKLPSIIDYLCSKDTGAIYVYSTSQNGEIISFILHVQLLITNKY